MDKQTRLDFQALRVCSEGKFFNDVQVDDGNTESGPIAYEYKGFRLGKVQVTLTPRGELYMFWPGEYHPMHGDWDKVHHLTSNLVTPLKDYIRSTYECIRLGIHAA